MTDNQLDQRPLTGGSADHAEEVVPAVQLPRGATNTGGPVSADAENGTGDLRASIRRAIADPGAVVAARWPGESGPAWSARAVEQTLLAAGWRPPLPEPPLSREDLGRRVADVCVQWLTWSPAPSSPQPEADLLARFVSASLEFDYTAEGDCGSEYEDDEQEREAAIANIVEMHRLLNLRAERLAEAHEKLHAMSSPLPNSEQRGVWLSPDGKHLAIEAEDGELEELESDPDGGWLLKGMLDCVPDHWVRLVPLLDSETERQRWFVIAGPGIPTELGERPLEADWDGKVYPALNADLAASLTECRKTYDDWGVYELVRVPDEGVSE